MASSLIHGQITTNLRANFEQSNVFQRKFLMGFSVNNSWANYRDLTDSSFYRPSLGIHLRAEYNITEYLGICLAGGIQQRGMGVYTEDLDNSIGNPDSTGRLRYRSTTIDFPLELSFRPTKELFNNTRLHIGIGVTPSIMFKAQRIWKSIDDGFHEPRVITSNFSKIDFPLRASLGLDVNVAGGVLFRAQGVFEYGLNPIYTHPITGAKSNKNILIGIDLSFLF